MKAYKGFNRDMTCRGFQFEEGKTYEEDRAELCEAGFHACENPMDCMGYYNPAESVYHEVELDDVSPERKDDTNVCGKKIRIGARISIPKFVELSIQYMKEHCSDGGKKKSSNTGYRSMASNTGDQSMANNTGYQSMASVEGVDSLAVASGYKCKAKACIGSAICLAERGRWNGETYPLLAVKAAIVDGDILKPDTWYELKNGEFVEADDGTAKTD